MLQFEKKPIRSSLLTPRSSVSYAKFHRAKSGYEPQFNLKQKKKKIGKLKRGKTLFEAILDRKHDVEEKEVRNS